MKLRRLNPCNECPFRKNSIDGWLGPWSPQGMLQQVHGEAGLGCHVDVAAKLKKSPKMTDGDLAEKTHVCVGSLKHADKSFKSYRNTELREFQDRVAAAGDNENILDRWEFLEHHANIPNPRKSRKD